MHPEWYYKYFQAVFASNRDYKREIALLGSLNGISVEEIGAGTGNHVAEMLEQMPRHVLALDLDPCAIPILRSRFAKDERVAVELGDGFSRAFANADIVACFYCLVQQTTDFEVASHRLYALIQRCVSSGAEVFFEWMDINVHLAAHSSESRTRLYSDGRDFLDVRSRASKSGAIISYRGVLEGRQAKYDVPLLRLPMDHIAALSAAAGAAVDALPLSPSRRRFLLHLSSR
jgi:SAM-dependent methyltransferase